jgi:hypothetical protein
MESNSKMEIEKFNGKIFELWKLVTYPLPRNKIFVFITESPKSYGGLVQATSSLFTSL